MTGTPNRLLTLLLSAVRRARAALELLPLEERATLKSILRCLEGEFNSDAKQTACSMVVNTREYTEREYAHALQHLALYAYKNTSQNHIVSRCSEQFLAGLRCRDVKAHLGWFCSKNAKVHELVSHTEAFRATREEAALMSDPEGSAVTFAYVQGNKPGKSFAQHQRLAAEGNAGKHQGDGKSAETFSQNQPRGSRTGCWKVLFQMRKEGTFHC